MTSPEPLPPGSGGPAADGETADATRLRLSRRVRAGVVRFLSLRWVPLAAALLALPLSATALFVSLQQPEVILILPDQVRVAQGRQSGAAYVYLQPAFVSTGANERIEVIRDMALEVTGPGGPTMFSWSQQLRLVSAPDGSGLSYEYAGDAVPLVVGPREAASPLSLFEAPPGWFFAPGDYRFTLVGERVVTGQPISAEFAVTIAPTDIEFLERPGPEQFLTFPIR